MDNDFPEIPEEIKKLFEKKELDDDIRLDKDGNWLHNGEPFTNKKIIDFFNRSINVTRDGTYVIHYGEYTYPITVEDAPLFVTGVWFKGFGRYEKITINLTNGTEELLDIHSLYYKNKTMYCRVFGGRMIARFRNSPFYHLMERLDEVDGQFYLTLCGEKIHIKQDL
ncbi:MAG TPA: DUF1285 domain-containing protein [Spirochaetota bacterium]|nr:DUF1285 domain-containing protein [Spirochaetota bacterium]HPV41532.1 DUF1285 domain-containing protein [Spirochaetota bacterium]